jgi:hypothetical protein
MTPVLFPWVNIMMKDDAEGRAFTIGSMFTVAWAFFAWSPVVLFPVLEAPRWLRGYATSTALVIVAWMVMMMAQYLHSRELVRTAPVEEGRFPDDTEKDTTTVHVEN